MKKLNYIFIAMFCSVIMSQFVNAAVIDEVNGNGSCINQILRTSHYWGKSFIEYFLSSATQDDIESLKLCRNKELIKYIDDFFEDYKESYGKKGSIPPIFAWKWLGAKQSIKLQRHDEWINKVEISHDNKFIVTCSDDKAMIWDSKTGKLIKILIGHTAKIISLAVSHDDNFIVTGSEDETAKIWDKTGKLINTLIGHESYVRSIAISHDDKFIVTCSNDETAKIWNIKGELIKTLEDHTWSINSVVISHNDKFIVTGSTDKTAKIWDGKTGNLIKI